MSEQDKKIKELVSKGYSRAQAYMLVKKNYAQQGELRKPPTADMETNFIKNFHDAIGMDSKTPGYGKLIGKNTSELYNNWAKKNDPEDYLDSEYLQTPGNSILDNFYGTNTSPLEAAKLYKSFITYPEAKEYRINLRKKLGVTTEGYKYNDPEAPNLDGLYNTQSQVMIPQTPTYKVPNQGAFGESGIPYAELNNFQSQQMLSPLVYPQYNPTKNEQGYNFDISDPTNETNVPSLETRKRMAQNREYNVTTDNYDENGNAKVQQTPFQTQEINRVNVANLYGGVDLEGALAYAGRGFGEGDPYKAITGTGLSLIKGGRNFLSGFATGKSDKETFADYMRKINEDQTRPEYAQQGGKIKNSEVMAMRAITDTPNGNTNVEGKEFIKRTNGMPQPVVGEPHHKNGKLADGVNVQLNDGDKVLSDYVKLRPQDIKELKDRYNISLKRGDTPAKALSKIESKIGLKKETEKLADTAEKLEKALKIKDKTTKELSLQTLQMVIATQNEKINALKEVSAVAFEDLFDRQEDIPKKGDGSQIYDDNGKEIKEDRGKVAQQGGQMEQNPQQDQVMQLIQAYAQASGQDPQAIMQQLQQMQPEQQQQALQSMAQELQGGQEQGEANQNPQEEEQEMMAQQGGIMELASKYGISPQRAQELMSMQQGGMQSQQEEQMEGQASNPQEEQGEVSQEEQIMQMVMQMLQKGATPQQVVQELVKMGLPQEQAVQAVEMMMQQSQGEEQVEGQMSNPREEQMETAQQGGEKLYAQSGLTYEQIVAKNVAEGTNLNTPGLWTGQTATNFYTPYSNWESYLGRSPRDITTQEIYQKGVTSDLNPQITKLIETGEMPLTNKHRELLKKAGVKNADKITDYTTLSQEDKKKIGKDFVLSGYVDKLAGHRGVAIQPGDLSQEEYTKLTGSYDKLTDKEGRQIYAKYDKDGKIQRDEKGNLTFYYPKKMGVAEKKVEPSKIAEETTQIAEQQELNPVVRNKTVLPWLPQDLRLPPSAIPPLRKPEIALGRIEPIKQTVEPYLAEQARQQLTAREQLSATGLPPQTQEAVSAQQLASGQMASNDAISRVENFNRTNQFQADQFNIGQRAKEDITNEQFAKTYQDNTLGSMANTERDWRAYYNDVSSDNARKYSFIENTRTPAQEQYTYVPGQGYTFNNNQSADIATSSLTPEQARDMTPKEWEDYKINEQIKMKKKVYENRK